MAQENKIFESALHYTPALADSYKLALILFFVFPNENLRKRFSAGPVLEFWYSLYQNSISHWSD